MAFVKSVDGEGPKTYSGEMGLRFFHYNTDITVMQNSKLLDSKLCQNKHIDF